MHTHTRYTVKEEDYRAENDEIERERVEDKIHRAKNKNKIAIQ